MRSLGAALSRETVQVGATCTYRGGEEDKSSDADTCSAPGNLS